MKKLNLNGKAFSFTFDEEIHISIKGQNVEKIIGRIDKNGQLITYVKIAGKLTDINNLELEDELLKNNDKSVLTEYKNQVERISNI